MLSGPLFPMTFGISPNSASGARWQPLVTYYPDRSGFSVLGGNPLRHSTSPIELRNSSWALAFRRITPISATEGQGARWQLIALLAYVHRWPSTYYSEYWAAGDPYADS